MTSPNVINIIFDDMTVSQLQRMPHLMRLAQTGVQFSSCFSTTPLCAPARATLRTGQYSHNTGIVDNQTPTADESLYMQTRMQAHGYKTCHVGKYNNQYTTASPQPPGWDEWHAIAPQQYYGAQINDNGVVTTLGTDPSGYHTTVCGNRALAFLTSATEPFFMQLSFKCPHYNQPTTDFLNAVPSVDYDGCLPSSVIAPRPPNFNVVMGSPPAYMAHAAMDSAKIDEVDAFWRGSAEELFTADRILASISALLVSSGKTNTIINITSDHGFMRGQGRDPAEKIVPYLPAMQIPLIISGPSNLVAAQGGFCSALVGNIDLVPTIYALTGATSTLTVDGVSLAPFLSNPGGPAVRSNLLFEFLGTGNTGWGVNVPTYQAVMSKGAGGSFLYTLYSTAEEELYDLLDDPWQLINQASNPSYATVKSHLAALIAQSKNCVGSACVL